MAHLVAQLQRHALASTSNERPVDLTLELEDGMRKPDLEVLLADRVYGVWYDLTPGAARLRASSRGSFLEPQRLRLSAGRIERFAGQLLRQPIGAQ